jgi:peptidyl-prolyl cis-trans isomerase D
MDGKRFEVANIGHVIAKLKSNSVSCRFCCSSHVESILKNKKKAELIKAKMTGSSLED